MAGMTRSPKPRAVRAWALDMGQEGLCPWACFSKCELEDALFRLGWNGLGCIVEVEIRPAPKRRKKARRKA